MTYLRKISRDISRTMVFNDSLEDETEFDETMSVLVHLETANI